MRKNYYIILLVPKPNRLKRVLGLNWKPIVERPKELTNKLNWANKNIIGPKQSNPISLCK